MAFIQLNQISACYGSTKVLDSIDLDLKQGEIYAIIGPSGSGKSTLLHAMCGIVHPHTGKITLKGEILNPKKHVISFVPQNYGLLDWERVEKNILLPQRIRKEKSTSEFKNRYNDTLDGLNISTLTKRYPKELSGGQRQRVALARAFIQLPDLLLMDEPFSALDTLTSENSQKLFINLWKKNKVTTIFTTHNVSEAVKIGQHIIIFTPQPGKIAHVLENPVFDREAETNDFEFINFTNKIKSLIKKEWIL